MKQENKLTIVTEDMWEQVNEFNQEVAEQFLNQLHLSPHTLKQYRSGVRQFFWWTKKYAMNKPLHKLKARDALGYQNFLIKQGLGSAAIKFKRSVVSSMCGFVELYYEDDYPSFRNIFSRAIPSVPNTKINEKKPLTVDELQNLSDELERREDWQKLAYLWFTYSTGCRRSESAQVKKEVVGYEPAKEGANFYRTHPIRAKGRGLEGKVREFTFDERAMKYMKKWMEVRGEDDVEELFVSRRGSKIAPLQPAAFNDWCREVFAPIVGRRVHPHLFRSSRATNAAVHEGKDINQIAALLGHNDISTTQIYIVDDSKDDVSDLF